MTKLYPAILLAASTQSYSAAVTAPPSPGLALTKVIFVLAFIVVLILFSAWFARRSGFASFVSNENFKVIASLSLGQKEKAVLIKAGKHHILLGVAPGGVSTLHTFLEGENPLSHTLIEEDVIATKPSVDFSSQIKKLLTQGQQK